MTTSWVLVHYVGDCCVARRSVRCSVPMPRQRNTNDPIPGTDSNYTHLKLDIFSRNIKFSQWRSGRWFSWDARRFEVGQMFVWSAIFVPGLGVVVLLIVFELSFGHSCRVVVTLDCAIDLRSNHRVWWDSCYLLSCPPSCLALTCTPLSPA